MSFPGLSQDIRSGHIAKTYEILQGYFVDVKGDTCNVRFIVPFQRNAIDYREIDGSWIRGLKYIDGDGNKKVLSLWHTRMFSFYLSEKYSNQQIKMVAYSNWTKQHSDTGTFLKLQVDGKLRLLIHFVDDDINLYGMIPISRALYAKTYFFQKEGSEIVRIKYGKGNFRKQLTEYLADDPELVGKIQNGVYTYKDCEQIANEYNRPGRD